MLEFKNKTFKTLYNRLKGKKWSEVSKQDKEYLEKYDIKNIWSEGPWEPYSESIKIKYGIIDFEYLNLSISGRCILENYNDSIEYMNIYTEIDEDAILYDSTEGLILE